MMRALARGVSILAWFGQGGTFDHQTLGGDRSFLLIAIPHPAVLLIFVGRPLSRPLPLSDFAHFDTSWLRRMSCSPVFLKPPTKVVAGLLKAVFVEDDIPHLKWALGKLLSSHHLHVHVLRLRLAARLHQTLQNLWRGDLQVD